MNEGVVVQLFPLYWFASVSAKERDWTGMSMVGIGVFKYNQIISPAPQNQFWSGVSRISIQGHVPFTMGFPDHQGQLPGHQGCVVIHNPHSSPVFLQRDYEMPPTPGSI